MCWQGSGFSGLGTIISGAYIAVDPGAGTDSQRTFVGLEQPPIITSDTPGTVYHLKSEGLGSLSIGSPVYFRQIPVGEVTGYHLSEDHRSVNIALFVRKPHDQFVFKQSRFYNVAGFDLGLGAEGVNLEVESLTSLLSGGVAFKTPIHTQPFILAEAEHIFHLFKNHEKSQEQPITHRYPYVLYFTDTVRGLAVGAHVELRGIRIGTVQEISMERDHDSGEIKIPVIVEIEPERVPTAGLNRDEQQDNELKVSLKYVEQLVKEGLRARLQTGNFLTGQLYIELDFFPEEPIVMVGNHKLYPEIPTLPRPLLGIAASANRILNKLDAFPIHKIGNNVENMTAALAVIAKSEEWMMLLKTMQQVIDNANKMMVMLSKDVPNVVGHTDQLVTSVNKKMPAVMDELNKTLIVTKGALKKAEKTMTSMNQMMSPDGEISNSLKQTLEELSLAARSIRVMAEYLERHPEALIKGKGL